MEVSVSESKSFIFVKQADQGVIIGATTKSRLYYDDQSLCLIRAITENDD